MKKIYALIILCISMFAFSANVFAEGEDYSSVMLSKVVADNGDGTYKYAIGEKGGDLRSMTKEMNTALNGRGGGKPFFVQGSVRADEKAIRAFFEKN